MPVEESDNYWQYMLIRSAGWLAFHCKEYDQALQFAQWGLSGEPPAYEKVHLDNLWKENTQKVPDSKKEDKNDKAAFELFGFLSAADADTGDIKIRTTTKEKYQIIKTSQDIFQKTARYLIGEVVKISAMTTTDGSIIAQHIRKAISN